MWVPRSGIYYFSSASSHGLVTLIMSSLADLTYKNLDWEGFCSWKEWGNGTNLEWLCSSSKSYLNMKENFQPLYHLLSSSSTIWFCVDISFQLHGIIAFLIYLLLPAWASEHRFLFSSSCFWLFFFCLFVCFTRKRHTWRNSAIH